MKKQIVCMFILIFVIGIAAADTEDFSESKKIIDAKTPCSKLSEPQLETLGDYLMEQVHPGISHEVMDEMVGGEGSESLRLMHIAMAKRLYCNDYNASADYGFRGMMGYGASPIFGRTNYGGMMNMMGYNFGYGMMGQGYAYWGLVNFLYIVLVIGLIALTYLWIIKLWKEVSKKAK